MVPNVKVVFLFGLLLPFLARAVTAAVWLRALASPELRPLENVVVVKAAEAAEAVEAAEAAETEAEVAGVAGV